MTRILILSGLFATLLISCQRVTDSEQPVGLIEGGDGKFYESNCVLQSRGPSELSSCEVVLSGSDEGDRGFRNRHRRSRLPYWIFNLLSFRQDDFCQRLSWGSNNCYTHFGYNYTNPSFHQPTCGTGLFYNPNLWNSNVCGVQYYPDAKPSSATPGFYVPIGFFTTNINGNPTACYSNGGLNDVGLGAYCCYQNPEQLKHAQGSTTPPSTFYNSTQLSGLRNDGVCRP